MFPQIGATLVASQRRSLEDRKTISGQSDKGPLAGHKKDRAELTHLVDALRSC